MDKALVKRLERGKAPFDGLTLHLNDRPPEHMVVDLQRLVSALADRNSSMHLHGSSLTSR